MAWSQNLQTVLGYAKEISEKQDFIKFCNTRAFEDAVNQKVALISLTDDLKAEAEKYILENEKNENALCFVLFFIVYTICRKNKIGNLQDFCDKYINLFDEYEFTEFIKILTEYNTKKDDKNQLRIIRKTKKLIELKGDNFDFSTHNGVVNLYVEAVCSYFETNLDEREDEKLYIEDAKNKISSIINGGENKYPKFTLNFGRLEALLGNYQQAEELINRAISYIGSGETRVYTVHEYEQYLTKLNMIKLYDLNDKKIKEVEKIKTDNLKSLSLITALLGFLLGSINIFSTVTDVKVMALLMVTYLGLIIILLGILLFGIKLIYKEKNKKFTAYILVTLILGVLIFALSTILILMV